MHAAGIIQVDVSGRPCSCLSRTDAGIEVQPLPGGPPAWDQSQHVYVYIVDAASGDDLCSLGPILAVGPHLPAEVVVGRSTHRELAPDHGRVVVLSVEEGNIKYEASAHRPIKTQLHNR